MTDDLNRIASSLPPGWYIWQTSDGRILLQLRAGNITENLEGSTLSEVLKKADGYRIIPRIKRRPERFIAAEWEPAKAGNLWRPRRVDSIETIECYLKTRKECQETIERFERLSLERQEQWDADFSRMFPSGATEGVDFRWEGSE